MQSGAVLLGEVRRAGWRRVARGVYVPDAEEDSAIQRAQAWRCVLGDEVTFTSLTSAAMRQWWLPRLPDDCPTFIAISESDARPRRVGLRVSRHRPITPATQLLGLTVATAAETLMASARVLSLLDLAVLADSALHAGDCTVDDVQTAAALRRRGSRTLRTVLPLLDGRSESSGETLLRILHITAGVPVEPQFIVSDVDGIVARADLRIPGTRRLPEYDGAHHRDAAQYERDRQRDRRLQALGWEPYSYSIESVLRAPGRVLMDADIALGRWHDPRRIKAFYELLNASSYTKSGARALRARLGMPPA